MLIQWGENSKSLFLSFLCIWSLVMYILSMIISINISLKLLFHILWLFFLGNLQRISSSLSLGSPVVIGVCASATVSVILFFKDTLSHIHSSSPSLLPALSVCLSPSHFLSFMTRYLNTANSIHLSCYNTVGKTGGIRIIERWYV